MTSLSVPRPQLPRLFGAPLRLVPERVHSLVAATLLERIFARELARGELDFLQNRRLRIRVRDANVSFAVGLEGPAFVTLASDVEVDLCVSGSLYDFMLLITGREDPDTLFFQRHLRLEGDTGLGVHVKNFLASVDTASLPLSGLVNPTLAQCLHWYERLA